MRNPDARFCGQFPNSPKRKTVDGLSGVPSHDTISRSPTRLGVQHVRHVDRVNSAAGHCPPNADGRLPIVRRFGDKACVRRSRASGRGGRRWGGGTVTRADGAASCSRFFVFGQRRACLFSVSNGDHASGSRRASAVGCAACRALALRRVVAGSGPSATHPHIGARSGVARSGC